MHKRRKIRAEEFRQLVDLKTSKPIEIFTHQGKEVPTPQGMPSKIVILGQHFDVRYHTRIFNKRKESERLNGCIFYAYRLIFLDPDSSIHILRETLYHEVAHAYLHQSMMKNEHVAKLDNNQIETLCDLFGQAFYDQLLNNPA